MNAPGWITWLRRAWPTAAAVDQACAAAGVPPGLLLMRLAREGWRWGDLRERDAVLAAAAASSLGGAYAAMPITWWPMFLSWRWAALLLVVQPWKWHPTWLRSYSPARRLAYRALGWLVGCAPS